MIIIIFVVWAVLISMPMFFSMEYEEHYFWYIWVGLSLIWIIPLFTGVPIKNNEGQYKGYITAIEQTGAIFKGWNIHLKTELESSNEDTACINRDDEKLIERLKEAMKNKENLTFEYEGKLAYPLGVCPWNDWMIIGITKI